MSRAFCFEKIIYFFVFSYFFKNQGNNQNNFKKIKKSKQIEAFIFLFFVFLLKFLGPSLKKICCFSIFVFFNYFFKIKQIIQKIKNYFTSSDPHHDMLGGGCQVRVVI